VEQVTGIKCPECSSIYTIRFQRAEQIGFYYWTCWDCNRIFVVNMEEIECVS